MRERDIETWRPVAGYEGHYEVSDLGAVASVKRGVRRELAPLAQRSGHVGVGLCLSGVKTRFRVHRLVAAAFLGDCPDGCEVRHLDGDPLNNAAKNLAYGSAAENRLDAYVHGGRRSGDKSHLAKYSDAKIAEVMALRGKMSSRSAAKTHGLDASYVRQLWRGEKRAHDGKESQVEGYLVAAVKRRGGEVRKLQWVGRSKAPDRVVMLPGRPVLFVELKRPGSLAKFPRNGHERAQLREHERMRQMGQRVVVIDSIEGVERLLA